VKPNFRSSPCSSKLLRHQAQRCKLLTTDLSRQVPCPTVEYLELRHRSLITTISFSLCVEKKESGKEQIKRMKQKEKLLGMNRTGQREESRK
jgi:hypothetical protein